MAVESPRRLEAYNRRGVYQHDLSSRSPTDVMIPLIIW